VLNSLEILQPDDWHVHLREGDMLKMVTNFSSRINNRCVVMPNTIEPITDTNKAIFYKNEITKASSTNFEPLIPCYLTESLDVENFRMGLQKKFFFGAKLYPANATTNSKSGVSNITNIYKLFEILEEEDSPLLIHGEKVSENIDIFDREKHFIDDELVKIRDKFPKLRIVLEHVSTEYGVKFIKSNKNIAGSITPHHMLLTKEDVFFDNKINPHHFCMPVVKNENDLIELRNAACNNNSKFFLGTDSAPHPIQKKTSNLSSKPGIFSAPCSLELYAEIFDQENALNNLETFSSINGPKFYKLHQNTKKIKLVKKEWIVPDFSTYKNIKVKNFYANKKINWKLVN
tara:strand:+ start:91 stop:1125 length:1035 start_codon:yes stop_codon:yes gene_type:complete